MGLLKTHLKGIAVAVSIGVYLNLGAFVWHVHAQEIPVASEAVPSPAEGEAAKPPPPEAVVAIGSDRAVNLSWLPSPAANILGYNIYRSTEPGKYGTVPVNRSLITGTEFIDNEANSIEPPENGVVYFYTVKAVDEEGRLSEPSEEARARPEGAKVISEIPKIGWEGFGESQLSVSGRKVVSMGFTVRTPKFSPGTSQLSGPQSQRLNLEQQLQVRLNGTVGKKISVNVDYDDTAPDQTRQRISVVYAGDPQETIERAEFGDIRLQLSETEFTGYDKQLFGVRLQARPVEKLRVTGIATQTQGINASESFVGSNSKKEQDIRDTAYVSRKYFYISNPETVKARLGIKIGTERVWMDDGVERTDVPGVTKSVGDFNFDLLAQGADYSIDYDRGIIIFNRFVSNGAAIAVAFEYGDGTRVYFNNDPNAGVEALIGTPDLDGDGTPDALKSNWDITAVNWAETTTDAHLIFDGRNTGVGDAHMITNVYQIGFRNIVPKDFDPEFTIRIFDASGNEVTGIAQPVLDSEFYDFGILKMRNDPANECRSALGPTCPSATWVAVSCDPSLCPPGLLYPLVEEQPFAYDPVNNFYGVGGNAYAYGTNGTTISRYKIKLRFLTRVLSYRLRNINVVRGSERITMDGRLLSREVDYFIDYDFGQVTFLRQEQIRHDSRIQIDYEYLPFGGQFQSFLWGARAQYTLSDKTAVGVTYLTNNDQNPQDAPSPTAAPKSTRVVGADGRTFFSRRDLSSVVQIFPGFEHSIVPLEMEVRAEIAHSDINPNTFDQPGAGEKGGAVIDSMEGVDDVIAAGVDASAWFPAAKPEDVTESDRTQELAWSTGQGGHPGVRSELARTLDLQYRNMGSGKWDGLRYVLSPFGLDLSNHQFLELWVHGDNSGNRLVIDIGAISEDSNANDVLDTEDLNEDFTLNAGEDDGINHDGSAYWGAGNAVFWNGAGGPGSDVLNTEDMNGNGTLEKTNKYFEYRIKVDWTGWNFIKIPLGFDSKTLQTNTFVSDFTISTQKGAVSVARRKSGSADLAAGDQSVIRHMRVWLLNEGAGASSGTLRIETIAVTGNRWLLSTTADSGIFPDSSRFNVSAISQEIDASYDPLLKYFQVREEGAETLEKSLRIDYNLFDDLGGNYFATRVFHTPINLLDYKELRFEVNKANVINNGNGEILFIRAGGDDRNYFQYNIPLDHIGLGWQTQVINLRDDRNRHAVGTPTLSGVKQFSIGVLRLDPPDVSITETLWINNLRLVNPEHKTGVARKVNVRLSTPMGATFVVDPSQEILPANAGIIVDTTYREVDNDFRLIDQPSFLQTATNDQHRRSLRSIAQIRQIPGLPITANFSHDEAFVESHHRDDPVFFFAPDRDVKSYRVNVSSQHLKPVSLDVAADRREETVRFLTSVAGTDLNKVNWSVAPRARVPLDGRLLYVVPLGRGGEATAVARYSKVRIDFAPDFRNLQDRLTVSLDEQYDARTTYRPFSWLGDIVPFVGGLSSSPRAGFRMRRSRGTVGSEQVANIANPVSLTSKGFSPVTQKIDVGLDNRLERLKGVTPSINYLAGVRRDFTLQNMTTNSLLTTSTNLRPGDWLSFLRDQSFNFGYTIETNAQYYDITKPDGTEDRVTKKVSAKDMWWINKKDDTLSTSNAFAQSYNAGGRMVFWQTLAFTPNWSFREDIRLAQKLRTRTTSTTAGSGLSLLRRELIQKAFRYTPLFWLHFSGFDTTYNFRKSTKFDFKESPVNISESHSGTATLPFSPLKNMTGNFSVAVDKSRTRIPPAVTILRQGIRPSIGLGYTKSAGLEFPLLWWRIKLANRFNIRHTFQMNFIDNKAIGRPTGTRRAREIQDITEFEYEMMRGVNLRARGQYDKVTDLTIPNQSFQAFSFIGTFLFNF